MHGYLPSCAVLARQSERGKSRSSCESALRERGLQLGRYWLGQFADCSVRANFAEVHLIRAPRFLTTVTSRPAECQRLVLLRTLSSRRCNLPNCFSGFRSCRLFAAKTFISPR